MADFWFQQNGRQEPEPEPSLTPYEVYGGYAPDGKAGMVAPIGEEAVSLRDCWLR
ncbi:hypothetical protein GCM10010517_72990 [Streptosporangium fragile]|uniref:Uncharacterized protein n=1 Tax=Streptosporangium fragile TaxID=46186 RepID=A0ABN3W8V9_9ACTN